MTAKRFVKLAITAITPYGIVYLCRRLAPRIAGAVKKIIVQSSAKPLVAAARGAPGFIVTLTSYGERVEKTAYYAVCSLLSQTEKPDGIILYLAHGTKIQKKIGSLTRYGLEIKFCEDLKSYKKLVPALIEFPEDVLITADDDIFYPRNWMERLKSSYLREPEKIHCHRTHEIIVDDNHVPVPYRDWNHCTEKFSCKESIFPTTGGGVLFPPHSLDGRVSDVSLFTGLAPAADDIWFWAMAKLKGTEYAVIKNGCQNILEVYQNSGSLSATNWNGGNDRQLKAVLNHFKELRLLMEKIPAS